jgi:hypothetical protein
MKREEAWPLIEELAAHATQERFVYYHRWRVGDVLIWDERAILPESCRQTDAPVVCLDVARPRAAPDHGQPQPGFGEDRAR